MRVCVSGGAGYIGSHTVLALVRAGHDVVVVDDFSNSKPTVMSRVEALAGRSIETHAFNLCDVDKTEHFFATTDIDAVIHFAGFKAVGESVEKPLDYYVNNLDSTLSLVRAMRKQGVDKLVFSSSATVYGEEAPVPYVENYVPLQANNPYGRTKVMIEHILTDVAHAAATESGAELKVALLRYFNPVGAHESGDIGEDPQGIPNNLMPFIAQVAVGRREKLQVFGNDYDTPDGTCRRDYIHVEDLAEGHVAALNHLPSMDAAVRAFNLGSGVGTSVLEMVEAFGRASGQQIPHEFAERRVGDVVDSWADPTRANAELNWRTRRSIDDMCADTWRWQSQNPQGYPDA